MFYSYLIQMSYRIDHHGLFVNNDELALFDFIKLKKNLYRGTVLKIKIIWVGTIL